MPYIHMETLSRSLLVGSDYKAVGGGGGGDTHTDRKEEEEEEEEEQLEELNQNHRVRHQGFCMVV